MNNHQRISSLVRMVAFVVAMYGLVSTARAEDLPSADEIVSKVNERDDGTSLTRTIVISMEDKRGKSRQQTALALRKYYPDEKRSAIFYLDPANIKDTAFLTYDYHASDREDDQWLYLPELRRVRRISTSNRGDYYLGTDLTYEDMKLDTKIGVADYIWTTTGTEDIGGHRCYALEGIPVDAKTVQELGYSKHHAWVDSELFLVRRNKLWDVNGNELKTVNWLGWKQIDNIWTVEQTVAENAKTGHKTTFTFQNVDYATDIPDDKFTERSLSRGVSAQGN